MVCYSFICPLAWSNSINAAKIEYFLGSDLSSDYVDRSCACARENEHLRLFYVMTWFNVGQQSSESWHGHPRLFPSQLCSLKCRVRESDVGLGRGNAVISDRGALLEDSLIQTPSGSEDGPGLIRNASSEELARKHARPYSWLFTSSRASAI